jgi:predicted small lipoprotein YifL
MVPPNSGVPSVPGLNERIVVRLAIIGVLAATLGLAGCGRKGPLELPPSAAASQPGAAGKAAQKAKAVSATEDDDDAEAAGFKGKGQKKQRGPKKPFILDPLID